MLSASLYITVRSSRNRLAQRLRRLREPRYLFGAIAGAAYFYFAVFMRFRNATGSGRRRGRPSVPPGLARVQAVAGALAGIALLIAALLAWILPTESGLLTLSDAETNLLVPAPVTRRELLVHRLLRSQLPLVFGAVMSAVFLPAASGARVRLGAGLFVTFVTMRIYFAGVTMARARLGAESRRVRIVAWAPLVLLLVSTALVVGALAASYASMPSSPTEAMIAVVRATSSGPASIVLWPFTAVAGPVSANSGAEFFARLPAALAVLALGFVWLL